MTTGFASNSKNNLGKTLKCVEMHIEGMGTFPVLEVSGLGRRSGSVVCHHRGSQLSFATLEPEHLQFQFKLAIADQPLRFQRLMQWFDQARRADEFWVDLKGYDLRADVIVKNHDFSKIRLEDCIPVAFRIENASSNYAGEVTFAIAFHRLKAYEGALPRDSFPERPAKGGLKLDLHISGTSKGDLVFTADVLSPFSGEIATRFLYYPDHGWRLIKAQHLRLSDVHLEVQMNLRMLEAIEFEQQRFDSSEELHYLDAKIAMSFSESHASKKLLEFHFSKVRIFASESLGMREYANDQNIGLSLAVGDLRITGALAPQSGSPSSRPKTDLENYKVEDGTVGLHDSNSSEAKAIVFTPRFLASGPSVLAQVFSHHQVNGQSVRTTPADETKLETSVMRLECFLFASRDFPKIKEAHFIDRVKSLVMALGYAREKDWMSSSISQEIFLPRYRFDRRERLFLKIPLLEWQDWLFNIKSIHVEWLDFGDDQLPRSALMAIEAEVL